ncbi:MAG: YfhO family protein [Anaerolineaceae bacterium]|nr:YfhO family protein [Anaerolineaceae bacterium]
MPGTIVMMALVFLWPLVLHPNQIPMMGKTQLTDFVVSHLSYAQYIHNMWFTYGHAPLWNSSLLSGMPLIADPLSGYFYLPNWLTFIFPIPAAYNFLFFLHLAWTGWGLFLFLRTRPIRPLPALFGAIAWMGTTKLMGYIGSGQVSSVFALAWYPWLLLAVDHLTKSLSLRSAALASGVLAIIILVDIRWGFFAAIISLAFLICRFPYRKNPYWKIGAILALYLAVTFLLTTVLTIPLYELILRTGRASLTTIDRAIFSVDASGLLGAFIPQFGILEELITYFGIEVLVLALFGLGKKTWFWIGLVGFSILFSIGLNGPLFPLFSQFIPGSSWLRVPSRSWFFVALGCAILSAYGLDFLYSITDWHKIERWFRPISFAISLFAVLLAVGVAVYFPPIPPGILVFAIFLPCTLLLINFFMHSDPKKWGVIFILLMVSDLVWVNSSVFRSLPLDHATDAVRWLEAQPGLFRVYSPSYNIPLPNQLQTAEGVNPTHLQDYGDFMAEASHIVVNDYSVSVPGIYLDQKSPPEDFKAASSPDFARLGLLNVKYIVTSFPLAKPVQSTQKIDNVYISINPDYRERAWINNPGNVKITYWSPDRIESQVNSPQGGTVVFSEIDYPGWNATLDNKSIPVERVDNLLRGVQVPSGAHKVVLNYLPLSFLIGLAVSVLGWITFFIIVRGYAKTLVARARSAIS